jgi:prepilin-type N-terminal cleavage/methylation domain-containing protein
MGFFIKEKSIVELRNKATCPLTSKVGKGKGGFTLLEIIIVLATVGILAAVLAPTLSRYVYNSKLRKATEDVKNIGEAIGEFYNDLADWPVWQDGTARQRTNPNKVSLLYGPGDLPVQGGAPSSGIGDTLESQIVLNTPGYPTNPAGDPTRMAWRGPYIEQLRPDPWGNAYLVNVEFLWPENETNIQPVYVLSAGPDEMVQTNFGQSGPGMVVSGDDIVFRIK